MIKKINISVLFTAIVLFASCWNEKQGRTFSVVQYSGALMNIMGGNIERTLSLDSLADKDNLYALGAIENLKGEIQIFDSEAVNSSIGDGTLAISDSFHQEATLLVYTQVEEWESYKLPPSAKSKAELEVEISRLAKEHGMDSEKPFPFLIEGTVASLTWHVIDWKDEDKVHTHKKHQESGLNGIVENETVEILEFYSTKHKAVFTHH